MSDSDTREIFRLLGDLQKTATNTDTIVAVTAEQVSRIEEDTIANTKAINGSENSVGLKVEVAELGVEVAHVKTRTKAIIALGGSILGIILAAVVTAIFSGNMGG